MLLDALSEVTKVYPPLKLKVFVNDKKTFTNGWSKELLEMPEKVPKKLKVEKRHLKLSVIKGREDGKKKTFTS